MTAARCPLCGNISHIEIMFKEKMDYKKMADNGMMIDGDMPDFIHICEACHDRIHPKPVQKTFYVKWPDLREALLKCDVANCNGCINDGDDLKILSTWFIALNSDSPYKDKYIEYGRIYRIIDDHLSSGKLSGKYIKWDKTRRQLKELLRNKRFVR